MREATQRKSGEEDCHTNETHLEGGKWRNLE